MSHEDVKLEAWQAAVSPKLYCCTELWIIGWVLTQALVLKAEHESIV